MSQWCYLCFYISKYCGDRSLTSRVLLICVRFWLGNMCMYKSFSDHMKQKAVAEFAQQHCVHNKSAMTSQIRNTHWAIIAQYTDFKLIHFCHDQGHKTTTRSIATRFAINAHADSRGFQREQHRNRNKTARSLGDKRSKRSSGRIHTAATAHHKKFKATAMIRDYSSVGARNSDRFVRSDTETPTEYEFIFNRTEN